MKFKVYEQNMCDVLFAKLIFTTTINVIIMKMKSISEK